MRANLSIEKPFFNALTNKKVTNIWRGHGSAVFFEFGKLKATRKLSGEPGEPEGEVTLMIEWTWRISDKNSILAGTWSNEEQWPKHFQTLIGSSVLRVELFAELPEILVTLSCGRRIASFMISDGQPEWSIIARTPELGSLCVENSNLIVQSSKS